MESSQEQNEANPVTVASVNSVTVTHELTFRTKLARNMCLLAMTEVFDVEHAEETNYSDRWGIRITAKVS